MLRFRSERFSGPVNKERIRSLGGSVVNQNFSMQEGRRPAGTQKPLVIQVTPHSNRNISSLSTKQAEDADTSSHAFPVPRDGAPAGRTILAFSLAASKHRC